jgi:lysyl-tRNA synthetase class 2
MTEHEADRRKKLEVIKGLGLDPYSFDPLAHFTPIHAVRHAYNAEDCDKETGPVFTVAGRILLRRGMGKLGFVTLTDSSGNIQLAFDHQRLTETLRTLVKNLDLGDIIVATGNLCATQTGEITIWVNEFEIASKALLPPPDKRDGLRDQETRYRNRHQDLWTPEVMAVMKNRSLLIRRIRQYLTEMDYIEVETPIMQASAGGAVARPFTTFYNGLDMTVYMRIAPELYLKRLLIGGFDKVFEIGRNFRNEGISPKHNPEFTSLEAYCAFANYERMMELVASLVRKCCLLLYDKMQFEYQGKVIDLEKPFRVVRIPDLPGNNPQEKYDHYEQHVEQTLVQPTFVTHLPMTEVPLAKESKDYFGYAEMFEFVMAGQEIAPGYTENNDPDAQLVAFRAQAGLGGHVMDREFVEALKCGMPPAGGMGLGIDRLVAILTDQASIRDVILFPLLRPR